MDLRQLGYFVHVAELGSFSKAASLLSIAQSALSTRARKLEVELKQPLLHRNGRGVTPTDAGKRLLQHARGILMQVDRTREELAEFRSTPSGHIVIGLPPTIARLLTVPVLKDFRGHFAEASIGIMEGLSASIVEWLTTGRIDIGLVYNPALPLTTVRPYNAEDSFSIQPIVKPKLMIQLALIVSAQRPTTTLTQQVLQRLPQTVLAILNRAAAAAAQKNARPRKGRAFDPLNRA